METWAAAPRRKSWSGICQGEGRRRRCRKRRHLAGCSCWARDMLAGAGEVLGDRTGSRPWCARGTSGGDWERRSSDIRVSWPGGRREAETNRCRRRPAAVKSTKWRRQVQTGDVDGLRLRQPTWRRGRGVCRAASAGSVGQASDGQPAVGVVCGLRFVVRSSSRGRGRAVGLRAQCRVAASLSGFHLLAGGGEATAVTGQERQKQQGGGSHGNGIRRGRREDAVERAMDRRGRLVEGGGLRITIRMRCIQSGEESRAQSPESSRMDGGGPRSNGRPLSSAARLWHCLHSAILQGLQFLSQAIDGQHAETNSYCSSLDVLSSSSLSSCHINVSALFNLLSSASSITSHRNHG